MVARVAFVPAGAVDGTRACTMPHERAAIKAPAQPYTTPAPTDGDGLFLRLMRTAAMPSQTILSAWIKWSRHQPKKLAQDAVGAKVVGKGRGRHPGDGVQAFMVAHR